MHIFADAAVVSMRIHFLFDSIFHREEELKVTGWERERERSESRRRTELMGSLKLGNVCFLQLICCPTLPINQLNKNQNIA